MPNFKQKPMEPSQLLMFPISVDESIPADSDVRMLSDVMDLLDWSCMEGGYSETGCPAYPPKILCKILVYGYSKGMRSSRVLEDAVRNDKRFIWLSGGLQPDHCTISRFRKDKESALKDLFKGTVRVAAEAGLVLLNTVSVDGTKIQARASKRSLYDDKRIRRESEAIERIFQEAQEADRSEDELYGTGSGGEIPTELKDPVERKKRLDEIAKRLSDSKNKSVSSTEEDCRVMKTTAGLRPSYNVQAAVDSESRVIVAADVIEDQTDNGQLIPMLEQMKENTGCKCDVSLADTGYSDEGTYKGLEASGQDALIPPKLQSHEKARTDLFASKCFFRDDDKDTLICPAGRELTYRRTVKGNSGNYRVYTASNCRDCSFYEECVSTKCKTGRSVQLSIVARQKEAMIERLKTAEGKEIYSLRQQTVETVFANIKGNMKFVRFMLSGKAGAKSEIWLICMAHNLLICARKSDVSSQIFMFFVTNGENWAGRHIGNYDMLFHHHQARIRA